MSLKQRIKWGNSLANNSIALYLSLPISLIIYCSDSLSPSFTTNQPHHSFSPEVTVQQSIPSIYPGDAICPSSLCWFRGFSCRGAHGWLSAGAFLWPWAWPVSRMLLWFCLMTAALTLAILALFLLQPLALLTQLFVGMWAGELSQPWQCSPLPKYSPELGQFPWSASRGGLTNGSAEAAEQMGCLQGTEGRSKPLPVSLALPNTIFL